MHTADGLSPRQTYLYNLILSTADLTVWEYDPSEHTIIFSDQISARRVHDDFGLEPVVRDVPNALLQFTADSRSREDIAEMYRRIDSGEKEASCSVWLARRGGGDPLCCRISYVTVPESDGMDRAVYGICSNITAQKSEELKYRKAYQALETLHPLSLGSFHLNLTRNTCSDGKSPLDFVLKQQESGTADGYFAEFSKLIADEHIKQQFVSAFTREKLIALFRSGTSKASIEYPIIYGDGEIYWRDGLLYMIENPVTGDIEAVTYAIDINQKKKLELATQAISSGSCDFIALLNPFKNTSEFLALNYYENAEASLHKKIDYRKDRDFFAQKFILPEERSDFTSQTDLTTVTDALQKDSSYTVSYRQTSGGRETRKQIKYCWLDSFHREIAAIQTDVTLAYRQEQQRLLELKDAVEQSEKANRAKTEFISRISHDIRTPIGAIRNLTDFALEDIGDPVKLKNDLEKIRTSDTFLLSLINDVLDISKIDSGKIELHPEPYPFEEYIENIRLMFEPLCREKGIHFTVTHTPACSILVGDKIRLNQIVFNILSNAVKYTPAGGSVLYDSHSHDIDENTICYEYTVKDTGIGMSGEYQQKLFQPFTQDYTNPGRPKAETGTGLGLSIVKRLVDLMHGTISVKSTLGVGTEVTVQILLPLMSYEAYNAEKDRIEMKETAQQEQLSGTVLLAEDNAINREIAVRMLEKFGLTVVCAENGDEAVRLYRDAPEGTFRCLLLDLQMPVMNGYEAAEKIRLADKGRKNAVSIFAMTADAFTETAVRCRSAGMAGVILKPLDVSMLYSAIQSCRT